MANHSITDATKFRWSQPKGATGRRLLLRRVALFVGLATAVLLLVTGFWIQRSTEEALRDKLQASLETVLATDVAALEFWIENELSHVSDWSEQPDIQELTARLVELATDSKDVSGDLLAAPELVELRNMLEPLVFSDNYNGFGIVNSDGLVLAMQDDEFIGRGATEDGLVMLAKVIQGQAVMTRPYPPKGLLTGMVAVLDAPHMIVAAPVRNEQGKIIAAFFLFIPPEKDFTRILSIARLGETGDTYAFDRNGLMLSDSRRDDQLKAIGLIPDTPEVRSILRIQLRDPGGDMTRGYRPSTDVTARPLTKLVAAAVSGDASAQVILDAYRDYRGVKVVGAYQWLPQYDFGVATEISQRAAFAAMRPIRMMVIGLLGLVVLSAILILASTYAIYFLRRRVEEVKQLGQYTLERKIGEGGMGKVYLARHALLRRPTAIKFIDANEVSEENLLRFEHEVQLTSELTHPNTIEVYDYGRSDAGFFYYVMEFLPGLTLAGLMELEGAIPPARVLYILKQLCSSLAEAHDRGLIHRDVKPLNVILTERGGRFDFVKVLDFGLVKTTGEPASGEHSNPNEIPGTPPYIAPETLHDPSCIDNRSDLFSVGVIGFNLLTGQQPFDRNTAMEIAHEVMSTDAPRPSSVADQEIPPELDQLILDCMARNPEGRPANAEQIVARLDAIDITEPWGQEAARAWWANNGDRVGAGGQSVCEKARGGGQYDSTSDTTTSASESRSG